MKDLQRIIRESTVSSGKCSCTTVIVKVNTFLYIKQLKCPLAFKNVLQQYACAVEKLFWNDWIAKTLWKIFRC